MQTDNASSSVIQKTDDRAKSYARFYFRPRTPTQHNNEGVRTADNRDNESHCPVPVFFLLNAREVLTMAETMFADGNLKTSPPRSSAADFVGLPWEMIYHSSSLYRCDPTEKREIIHHRHAEVVVPNWLELTEDNLRFILCRSPAELRTLMSHLSPKARHRWEKKIGQATRSSLFFSEWTYVQTANLTAEKIQLSFNPSTTSPGPFRVVVNILEESTGLVYTSSSSAYYANDKLELSLENLRDTSRYAVKCYLDESLVYWDRYEASNDVPF
jgi:hypothetical protein